ncbi:MAG: HAMP domain-containing histidine kinase [Clostridia bacterium]|nr:HAMP domain-containing histidine kinase [Clostridia bacterium]
MKMRFWQKTYIFTLILFLACLNVGILSLTVYTYRRNVETTETAVSAEQYYVAMSFERDYNDMTDSNVYPNPSLLMQSFGTYYGDKHILLAFEENNRIVYSNFKYEYDIGDNMLRHTDFDGKRYILISSQICDGKYKIIFGKNVESLDTEFRSLLFVYIMTAIIVSLVLGTCLFFILRKLSGPLEKLRKATEVIEKGDFTVTVEEKGKDEFTLLARSFNAMLSKINEQMAFLEQEADRKQMLVDNMAHELRTPLTSIHGYAEYIEKAKITEEDKVMAAKYIMSEAKRLQKISEILLDDAFIRENDIEMKPTRLDEIMTDVADKLQLRADNAQVIINRDFSPVTISGNETLLSMLFYNLTENAIKACAPGGKVMISCGKDGAVIEDNGKGMAQEQLLHITEPFYRTDKSRSRAEGGAGLGLALCKRIANTHGATMRFESESGKGTKIFVFFTSPK